MIEILERAVFSDGCIVAGDLYSNFVMFFGEDIGKNP